MAALRELGRDIERAVDPQPMADPKARATAAVAGVVFDPSIHIFGGAPGGFGLEGLEVSNGATQTGATAFTLTSPYHGDPSARDAELARIDYLHRYNVLSSRLRVLRHFREDTDGDKLIDADVAAGISEDLSRYTTALRDYSYYRAEGMELFPIPGGLDAIIDRRAILEQWEAQLKTQLPPDDAATLKAIVREYRESLNNDFKGILSTTTSGMSRGRMAKARKAQLSRLVMATGGGLALVVPMLVMVLHPTQLTAILTTTIFVFAVAIGLAILMDDSKPKDVVACTAAYAAVLVVFVGASGGATS